MFKTGVMMKNKKAFSLWLIGPSASGKTTVSLQLFKALSKDFKNLVRGMIYDLTIETIGG